MKNNNQSNFKKSVRATLSPFGILSFVVLLLYGVSLMFPFIWSIVTSLRDPVGFVMERYIGYGLWPKDWGGDGTWANNYATVFEEFGIMVRTGLGSQRKVGMLEMIGNSVIYAVGSAILGTLACILVAYATSRFKFKFCSVIYTVVIIQMILPIVGSYPSEIKMATALGLYDNMFGMWIMKTFVSGLYYLVFYGAFQLIPNEYVEAAQLDGAGNWNIMLRIMFPFVKGSIFTIVLLKFIALWNDYQTPLLYMPTHPTFAYGIYDFTRGSVTGDTPVQLAAAMVMAVPLFVLFVAFQKRLLGDITVGGLK